MAFSCCPYFRKTFDDFKLFIGRTKHEVLLKQSFKILPFVQSLISASAS